MIQSIRLPKAAHFIGLSEDECQRFAATSHGIALLIWSAETGIDDTVFRNAAMSGSTAIICRRAQRRVHRAVESLTALRDRVAVLRGTAEVGHALAVAWVVGHEQVAARQ